METPSGPRRPNYAILRDVENKPEATPEPTRPETGRTPEGVLSGGAETQQREGPQANAGTRQEERPEPLQQREQRPQENQTPDAAYIKNLEYNERIREDRIRETVRDRELAQKFANPTMINEPECEKER